MVAVDARRKSLWPWLFFPGVEFFAFNGIAGGKVTGRLPFADDLTETEISGVTAEVERGIGVILHGVHPDFVAAFRAAAEETRKRLEGGQ